MSMLMPNRRKIRSRSDSILASLLRRQICAHRVAERPSLAKMTSDGGGRGGGVFTMRVDGELTPALQLCFSKEQSHILAVSDEAGFVSLFNTNSNCSSSFHGYPPRDDSTVARWSAHNNAVFDICWTKSDACMLTASGDQTIKLWDLEATHCLAVMEGHTGSVKSLSANPLQSQTFISGSRDGSIAFWDVRIPSSSGRLNCEKAISAVATIRDAHCVCEKGRRNKRVRAASKSVTSVLYLNDGCIIASAGDADSVVKFWDTRNLKGAVTQTPSPCQTTTMGSERRGHGIACLSQDFTGSFIIASCRDHKIYLYSTLQPDKGSLKTFDGHEHDSFYIKAAFSPDGTHILSGSSNRTACIWQVDRPEAAPVRLKGHEGEVTAVDWCPGDFGKIATCSDDFTVRVWSILDYTFERQCSNTTPKAVRHRVSAHPSSVSQQQQQFASGGAQTEAKADRERDGPVTTYICTSPFNVSTLTPPHANASVTRALFHGSPDPPNSNHANETVMHKTPDLSKSPASVLSPPSSVKAKTILHYFKTD